MKSDRYLNGYKLIYKPEHPNSMTSDNWLGYIYEHIYVMSKFIHRPLEKDEVVHHLDFDISNNNIKNLLLLPDFSHRKLHKWIESGCKTVLNSVFEKCEVCSEKLYNNQVRFCSKKCLRTAKVSTMSNYSIEEIKKAFDERGSILQAAKVFDISDNGLRKYISKLVGIEKGDVLKYLQDYNGKT